MPCMSSALQHLEQQLGEWASASAPPDQTSTPAGMPCTAPTQGRTNPGLLPKQPAKECLAAAAQPPTTSPPLSPLSSGGKSSSGSSSDSSSSGSGSDSDRPHKRHRERSRSPPPPKQPSSALQPAHQPASPTDQAASQPAQPPAPDAALAAAKLARNRAKRQRYRANKPAREARQAAEAAAAASRRGPPTRADTHRVPVAVPADAERVAAAASTAAAIYR